MGRFSPQKTPFLPCSSLSFLRLKSCPNYRKQQTFSQSHLNSHAIPDEYHPYPIAQQTFQIQTTDHNVQMIEWDETTLVAFMMDDECVFSPIATHTSTFLSSFKISL